MLTTLYLDMNSYFASVEQQFQPRLRGRPIAVSPVVAPSGCCIAASIEAKAQGVRTGMRVRDATNLCPDLTVVPSRPTLYVETHHKILEAVGNILPVDKTHSIDEASCLLMGDERHPAKARTLGQQIKDAIKHNVGQHLRSSVGISCNTFLAKVATDIEKPDGLSVLQKHELPGPLLNMDLTDLPGIGRQMHKRLLAAHIRTIEDLYARTEQELTHIWGGVVGARWWHMLRGERVTEPKTHRRSMGHEHVLEPERRHDDAALAVLIRLTHKACARMRHEGRAADRVTIGVRPVTMPVTMHSGPGPTLENNPTLGSAAWKRRWGCEHRFAMPCADTALFVQAVRAMWLHKPNADSKLVSVTLGGLVDRAHAEPSLFDEDRKRDKLWDTIDRINSKYKTQAVYSGAIAGMSTERLGGIAFHVVPDLDFVDTVGDKMVGGKSHLEN